MSLRQKMDIKVAQGPDPSNARSVSSPFGLFVFAACPFPNLPRSSCHEWTAERRI